MTNKFDLNALKNCYSSLLEHICSNEDFLKSSMVIGNIWKTTDHVFLQYLTSFFHKQPDAIRLLMPSAKLYSDIISFCGDNHPELLKWVKGFNNLFLKSVSKAASKNPSKDVASSFEFNQALRQCSDFFHKLKLRNEYLEKQVNDLQKELQLSQDKIADMTSSLKELADNECENFRKRMRSKISSFNVDESTSD